MIDPEDQTHPRNHSCGRCGAKPGDFCKTKTGKILVGYEKQHRSRHKKASTVRELALQEQGKSWF